MRLKTDIKPKEATFQVVLDALALTPFYHAFLITANVPAIYMQEFWATVSVHKSSIRFTINKKKVSLDVDIFIDILQFCPKIPRQVFEDLLLEQDILSFIRDLGHTGDITYLTDVTIDYLHQPWRAFATVINKCLSDKETGMNKICLSRAQILWDTSPKKKPDQATKGTRLKSKAKVAKPNKKKQPTKKTKAKGLAVLSEVALTEAEQIKLATKRSKKDFHISHASGSGVSDVPLYESESDKESWGDSEDEDDNDDDGERDDHDDDSDDERTETDKYDEEKLDDEEIMDDEEDDKVIKELYDDVNVNLGNDDTEMTDADQGTSEQHNVSQESGFEQEEEDAHVTLTPILDAQKADEPVQSSYVSSNFTSKLLNLENPSPANNEIASLLETSTHHATTIPEITSDITTTTPPLTPFFNPLLQQQTPTFTTPTVSALESKMFEFKQTNQFSKAVSSILGIVDTYLASKMKEAVDVDSTMKIIIKDQVKAQVSKIMPKIEKCVTESLGAKVLVRRKSGKDGESSKDSRFKENKSLSTSKDASQSQHKSSGKSVYAEEPSHTTWISQAALAEKPPNSFDEFTDTSLDFSAFVLNQLKIRNLTQEILTNLEQEEKRSRGYGSGYRQAALSEGLMRNLEMFIGGRIYGKDLRLLERTTMSARALIFWSQQILEHPSDTQVFTVKMEILLEPTSNTLMVGSISTWEDLTTHFLAQFFPPGRTTKLRNDILIFQQHQGLVSNFMASQDVRLSKFESDFKQQQGEMTNKIDTFLKAINDQMTRALPSDTVKNLKLNDNSTSLVLSARSYPTEDPQCSSHIHNLINAIKTCSKQPNENDQSKIKTLTVNEIGTLKLKEPEQPLNDEFKDLHLNLTVLEVLAHAPMYNAILDKYVERLELGKNGSAFIQGEMPKKIKDPRLFTLPCRLGDSTPFDTLADLGSCVNLILLYLFKKLKIGLLEETDHVFGLADGTKSYPVGIVKNVEVHIGRLKLLEDFYVIDMKKDPATPLLMGRGFLATASAVIDCRKDKIAVGEGVTRIGARTPYYAKKDITDYHLAGEPELVRDAKINPFKDILVFRKMVAFLETILINLKGNMWESEDLIENPINWDRPPKEGDGAWHIRIELIDHDKEKFKKTYQSIPTSRKLYAEENPGEIIDLDHFHDS
ncbi:MAK10-like protein [Tanacetum coccineum]